MVICFKCGKEHNGMFGSGKYCSRSCANSRNWSKEDKQKKSDAAKRRLKKGKWGFLTDDHKIKRILRGNLPRIILKDNGKKFISFKITSQGIDFK